MLVNNKVNFFPNGYDVAYGASCLDLPIAIAAGSICKESYYQLLFTLSYNVNWNQYPQIWHEERTEILKNMNFSFYRYKCLSWKEALEFIIWVIDQKGYVLMPVTYSALYYYLELDSFIEHMIMISGYDLENQLLIVNDCNFVKHGLNVVVKNYTVYQVALEMRSVEKIWEKSTVFIGKETGYHLYALKEKGKEHPLASEYISDFLSQKMKDNNAFGKSDVYKNEILKASTMKRSDDVAGYIFFIRRNFLGWLHPFFDYFSFQEKENITWTVNKLADKLYKVRHEQISRIHIRMLRSTGVTRQYILSLIEESEKIEEELFDFLKEEYFALKYLT